MNANNDNADGGLLLITFFVHLLPLSRHRVKQKKVQLQRQNF